MKTYMRFIEQEGLSHNASDFYSNCPVLSTETPTVLIKVPLNLSGQMSG
jgi:hypothetical protein